MTKQLINPASLAKPIGYSHGVLARGRVLALAGQTAMDATGRINAPDDFLAQFRQVLANLKAVLAAAGGQMTDIIQLTLYVTDKETYIQQRRPLGAVYQEFFGRYYPAMTLVEVSSLLNDDALIEITGLAVLENGDGL